MQITKHTMIDFMTRFGTQLFDRASNYLDPEYIPDQEPVMEKAINALKLFRRPFPAQSTAIQAIAKHLFAHGEKMVFLQSDMGTGKTLMSMIATLMAKRPQRVIVVCPPHLVQKWAREIRETIPDCGVYTVNHAGVNAMLARAANKNPGAPEKPEFWIIGRVRMRMSFRRQPAAVPRTIHMRYRKFPVLSCPDCGGTLISPATKADLLDTSAITFTAEGDLDVKPDADDDSPEQEDKSKLFIFSTWTKLEKRRTCQFVLKDGAPHVGCGGQLWQARRNSKPVSTHEMLAKAFYALPGIGQQKAHEFAALGNISAIVADLENGVVHKDLRKLLGKATIAKVQSYIDTTGFSIVDGDYAMVEFVKRHLPRNWFDIALLDELHELKGDDSAQGTAFGVLAGCVNKVIGLTGTLVDGYAQSLHPLLFRANPSRMLELGFGANDAHRFQREMGVIKEVVTETEETDKVTSRVKKKVTRQTRNLPGLHPAVISHILLPNAIFVELADIEKSLQDLGKKYQMDVNLLPSCREVFVKVPMSVEQQSLIAEFSTSMMATLKTYLAEKKTFVLAPIIAAILYYPDGCFAPIKVWSKRIPDAPLGASRGLPSDEPLPKEIFMRDLALQEKAAGRKLLIYTIYTDKNDLTGRYARILQEAGLRVRVLKASVSTEKREQWVKDAVAKGLDVLICNPELVKTGLDLFDFTSILFMQTGYRTDTVQQASRRSWRIGQQEPVRIYYAGYASSPQMQALSLVAKKMMVSNQAKGSIADIGLSSAIEDDDDTGAVMAMANAILDSIRDKSRDAITGAISSLEEDSNEGEFRASGLSVLRDLMTRHERATGIIPVIPADTITIPDILGDFINISEAVKPAREMPKQTVIEIETNDDVLDDLFADIFGDGPEDDTVPQETLKRSRAIRSAGARSAGPSLFS
jgi:hypothetical protein